MVGVHFPYSKDAVAAIKRLQERRWNAETQEWEVPLPLLPQVVEILFDKWESLPLTVREAFEKHGHTKPILGIDNTYTAMTGYDLPVAAIDDVCSFWITGAEYSQQYRDGVWDGQRHLFRKKGGMAFPTGLVSRIENLLKHRGIEFEVEDHRRKPPRGRPIRPAGPPLRDYQKRVLKTATQKERGVLQLATGAGKTIIAAHLIALKGLQSLFMVHTKDLLYQTIQVLETILGVPIGQIGDGRVQPQRVTVATIQTAARALHVKIKKEPGDEVPVWSDDASALLTLSDLEIVSKVLHDAELAIFDECHHIPAESFYDIAMKLPNAYYRYGLSATPWRADRSDLMIEAALGPKLSIVSSTDLIKKGYLVKPKITMYQVYSKARKVVRDYTFIYKTEVVENLERNSLIVESALHQVRQGKSVLILVNQVKHGRILEKMIEGAVFINGRDSSEVRRKALDRLRQKQDQILIATTLADEGLDIPSLEVLILAGAGKSETRALQRVGRVLRPFPGKEKAIIIDFWDETLYLQQHSRQRLEIYQTEPEFEVDIRPPRTIVASPPRQKILAEH
jgi:superfamily II DNA or RNA helicase